MTFLRHARTGGRQRSLYFPTRADPGRSGPSWSAQSDTCAALSRPVIVG
jgi:hypothetical protein